MKRSIFKIGIVLIVVAFFICVARYYHLNSYLSLEGFNNYRNTMMSFEIEHPVEFVLGYVLAYIILIILCIPGTILFDLIAGFIFGWFIGTALVIFSYGIGALLNFLLVRHFFKNLFENRFSKFKALIHGSGKYGLLINLTGLRLIAVIPFWILNIVAALINVRTSTFIISTLIGILPSTIIYVVIGDGVRDALNKGNGISPDLLVNPKIWIPIFIMAILLMLPNTLKYFRQNRIKNKIY